eukprot:gene22046-biopygen17690
MGRGRIAGAPTTDIWGRKAGTGRRLQAYGIRARATGRGRKHSWGPNPRHIIGLKSSPPG